MGCAHAHIMLMASSPFHLTHADNRLVGIYQMHVVKEYEFAVLTCGITSMPNFIKILSYIITSLNA